MFRWAKHSLLSGRKIWIVPAPAALVALIVLMGATTAGLRLTSQTVDTPLAHRNSSSSHNLGKEPAIGSTSAAAVLGTSTHMPNNGSIQSNSNGNNSATEVTASAQKSLSKSLLNYPYAPQVAQSGHLVMTPNAIVWGNVVSPLPDLVMSNKLEISEPTNTSSPDFLLSWYNDGNGHYSPGPYYVGWRPFLQPLHTITSDGSTTFNISAQDRDGNTYTTTLEVTWLAPRSLGMTMGSVNKQIQGSNVVYTGTVLFSPTSNVGTPTVHITASGSVNGNDPCNVGETNTTFTYTGQSSYVVSCVISADNLKNFPSGFDVYVNATTQWPPLNPVTYPAQFHAN